LQQPPLLLLLGALQGVLLVLGVWLEALLLPLLLLLLLLLLAHVRPLACLLWA
jgi:hypothetical protein